MVDVRGERRGGARSDKQYGDDMLVLSQLPALIEAGQLAGSMDRVYRLVADSIENPRSKQASTALTLLPSLLTSNVQAATASASTLLASLLHCYLHGEKFLQRDVPPLLHQCMALSGARSIGFFGAKERGASKNARERATSACLLHAVLSLSTASTFTAYDGCSSCPTVLQPPSTSAFSVGSLPAAEVTTVLCTLHAFLSDGQASTRYHARHAISLLCSQASSAALDVALKALPFEHAAAIKAIAPTQSPTSSPTSSPPSASRPRHNTMPSPPAPPSASPARPYATLPDEREWEEWKQQPGLVSPIVCEPLADADVDVDVIANEHTPRPRDERADEDDEVVVRVHTRAVSPVPFVGHDEEEDEISVVVAVDDQQLVHAVHTSAAAVETHERLLVSTPPSATEAQLATAAAYSAVETEAAESEAARREQRLVTPPPADHSPLSFTPSPRAASTEATRLSTKRKRTDSPQPAEKEVDKDESLSITSAAHWLQVCKEDTTSSHKRVVEVSVAATEWLTNRRLAGADKQTTTRHVQAAERQMSRMAAMMERVLASAEAVRRSIRAEAAERESA